MAKSYQHLNLQEYAMIVMKLALGMGPAPETVALS